VNDDEIVQFAVVAVFLDAIVIEAGVGDGAVIRAVAVVAVANVAFAPYSGWYGAC
jgi:hypothetical protein